MEGQIRTTVCQAQLLMDRKGKFHQFAGLVDKCENGDPSTTCEDLQGFWDMIFIQVSFAACLHLSTRFYLHLTYLSPSLPVEHRPSTPPPPPPPLPSHSVLGCSCHSGPVGPLLFQFCFQFCFSVSPPTVLFTSDLNQWSASLEIGVEMRVSIPVSGLPDSRKFWNSEESAVWNPGNQDISGKIKIWEIETITGNIPSYWLSPSIFSKCL